MEWLSLRIPLPWQQRDDIDYVTTLNDVSGNIKSDLDLLSPPPPRTDTELTSDPLGEERQGDKLLRTAASGRRLSAWLPGWAWSPVPQRRQLAGASKLVLSNDPVVWSRWYFVSGGQPPEEVPRDAVLPSL